jgi:hypothetical protein
MAKGKAGTSKICEKKGMPGKVFDKTTKQCREARKPGRKKVRPVD